MNIGDAFKVYKEILHLKSKVKQCDDQINKNNDFSVATVEHFKIQLTNF